MVDLEGPACTCPNDESVTDEDISREHGHRTGCPRGAWIVSLVPHPAGPDPARDARVDAYRDRERRRAARALDRYIEVVFAATDPQGAPTNQSAALTLMTASERFVEQVGDYVLARLGERGPHLPGVTVGGSYCGRLTCPGISECTNTECG